MSEEPDEQQQLSLEMRIPAVIDDDMLTKAVFEQGPQEYAGKIAKEEGISFFDVKNLRLDYRNIQKISTLWCFTSLVRLQLDNNLIEKIENLEPLVNLVWLDLSFNNIERIEGLTALVHLEDLILYNNRIQTIENLENQKKLQVLSLGNNNIKELEALIYLRRMKSLQTLNLNGNPISKRDDYVPYVSALLKNIIYFDHFLIDPAMREKGLENFDIALQKLDEEDATMDFVAGLEDDNLRQFNYNKLAFVENLDHGKLFDLLYEGETEVLKMDYVREVATLRQQYKDKFAAICQEVFHEGITRYEERMAEVRQLECCTHETIMACREHSSVEINKFLDYKAQLWPQLLESIDKAFISQSVGQYNVTLDELKDTLMDNEMLLVDQLEEVIRDFERNVREQLSLFLEFMHGHLALCRDLENIHFDQMNEMCIVMMEKLVRSELSEEAEAELSEILTDKENAISIVTTSHDLHLLRLDNREDSSVQNSNAWIQSLIDDLHDNTEMRRNRERVVEICHFVDHHREEGIDFAEQLFIQLQNMADDTPEEDIEEEIMHTAMLPAVNSIRSAALSFVQSLTLSNAVASNTHMNDKTGSVHDQMRLGSPTRGSPTHGSPRAGSPRPATPGRGSSHKSIMGVGSRHSSSGPKSNNGSTKTSASQLPKTGSAASASQLPKTGSAASASQPPKIGSAASASQLPKTGSAGSASQLPKSGSTSSAHKIPSKTGSVQGVSSQPISHTSIAESKG